MITKEFEVVGRKYGTMPLMASPAQELRKSLERGICVHGAYEDCCRRCYERENGRLDRQRINGDISREFETVSCEYLPLIRPQVFNRRPAKLSPPELLSEIVHKPIPEPHIPSFKPRGNAEVCRCGEIYRECRYHISHSHPTVDNVAPGKIESDTSKGIGPHWADWLRQMMAGKVLWAPTDIRIDKWATFVVPARIHTLFLLRPQVQVWKVSQWYCFGRADRSPEYYGWLVKTFWRWRHSEDWLSLLPSRRLVSGNPALRERLSLRREMSWTERSLDDVRRTYGISFEVVAEALGQRNPKNEAWRAQLRAITRDCVCRVCLAARLPQLRRAFFLLPERYAVPHPISLAEADDFRGSVPGRCFGNMPHHTPPYGKPS